MSFLTSHNWCHKNWRIVNLVILQKRVFVLYPSDMALLYLTVRLHIINRIMGICIVSIRYGFIVPDCTITHY
jgi:hypothetical protein